MLGPTLLSIHNIAYYLRLMDEIRDAIVARWFDKYRQGVLEKRRTAAS